MKEAPGPSVSEEISDIFINYNIDLYIYTVAQNPSAQFLLSQKQFQSSY